MVVARRLQSAWIAPLAAWGKTPRSWATAALGLGLIAVAGGEGRTQSGGCARCGPSVMAPRADFNPMFPAFAPQRAERRPPERRTAGGGAYTVCVRACDGAFFPVTYSGAATRADGLENVCRALCPNADVALYSLPFGGTIDEAVSSTGEPYGSLPNAHKFEQAYDFELLMPGSGAELGRGACRGRSQIRPKYARRPGQRGRRRADVATRSGPEGETGRSRCSSGRAAARPRHQRRRRQAQRRGRGDEPPNLRHSRQC